MKKHIILLLLLSIPTLTKAQEANPDKKEPKVLVEIRPIQYVLNGYSLVGHYKTGKRSQFGINVFAATLSDGITDFAWNTSQDLDMEAKQDLVLALSYRYFLQKDKRHKGFFFGLSLGWENYTLTERSRNEQQSYEFWYLAPRLGYQWQPFQKKETSISNFFLAIEAVGVIPIIKDDKATFSNGGLAEINNFLPSPLIGIGFQF